jgi:hypothetical protein
MENGHSGEGLRHKLIKLLHGQWRTFQHLSESDTSGFLNGGKPAFVVLALFQV